MIVEIKPYTGYKDSGQAWLGEIPAHWYMGPGFSAFRKKHVKNTGMQEKTVLSLSYGRIVVKPPEKLHGLVPSSFETYQIVEPGDIIIRSTDLQNDWNSLRIGLVKNRGIITSAYICLKTTEKLRPEYGYLVLHSFDLMKVFYGMGSGLRQNLDFSDFKRMPVFIPPLDEQAAIVRFLDHANWRLDKAIRAKRKLIALLNEQKQAIIHRAVTRGLDPNVPMREMGNNLLAKIPIHWEIVALRRYWEVVDCKHLTVPFVNEGIPLASVVEVQSFSLDLSRCKKTTLNWYRVLIEGGRKPKQGNLIYCRNASVGAAALVDTDIDFAMGQDVCLIRSITQNQRFLNYVLHSPFMSHQLELILVGSTFKRINISDIKALAVIVPPKIEQDNICEYLDKELQRFNEIINRTEREISLLREYKTRLTADVVTGKLDVREAARSLPEESGEPETLDEVETSDVEDDDEDLNLESNGEA